MTTKCTHTATEEIWIDQRKGVTGIACRICKETIWRSDEAANDPLYGLDELRAAQDAAYNEEHRYQDQFERMMDDENNDGARPPKALDESLRTHADKLAARYPRAAAYLRAEGYTYSNNHHKYGAGKKAMTLIASGGNLDEAETILKNWLPESSMWS